MKEVYVVGGEVTTDRIKWAVIDEIDGDTLWVTDEDGECSDISVNSVNSYTKP